MRNKLLSQISSFFLFVVLAALPSMAADVKPTQTLRIGVSLPLNAPIGIETKKAIEIILDDIDKSGGLVIKGQRYKVEPIIYDDNFSADKGRAVAERLIYQDKIRHMITVNSPAASAQIGVTEKNNVLLISSGATNKVILPGTRYSFRTALIRSIVLAGVNYLRSTCPEAKSIVLLTTDDEAGRSGIPPWVDYIKYLGLDLYKEVLYHPLGETDFGPIALRLTRINPDAVFVTSTQGATDFGLQLKAYHAAGFKGKIFTPACLSLEKVKQVASNEAMEGVFANLLSYDNPNAPNYIKEFKRKFTERFGWTDPHPSFFAQWGVFFAAVRKADSLEPDDIAAAMRGLKFDAIIGDGCLMVKGKFGVQGLDPDRYADAVVPCNWGVIRNGKIVWDRIVTPEEIVKVSEKYFGEKWRD